jgi:alkylation response protein AidB-like acyl-CoA dehydrogenase
VDLSLTPEQEQLRRTARDFATRARESGAPRGPSATSLSAWGEMAKLGWFSLAIPERLGGYEAPFDLGVLMEGLGMAACPGPVYDAAVLAPAVLSTLDTADSRQLLTGIQAGTFRPVVLIGAGSGAASTVHRCDVRVTGDVLAGTAFPVRHLAWATHVLVLAADARHDGGWSLVVVPTDASGYVADELEAFGDTAHRLHVDGVPLSACVVIPLATPDLAGVRSAVVSSVAALCAFQVGSCQAVLDMSVAYCNQRMQFGKLIGSFQRVQDHIIELLIALDSARWTTYSALAEQTAGPLPVVQIHLAKAVTGEAHVAACDSAHEVHAGIGCDIDYGLAPHTYLSRDLHSYLGSPAWHRRELVAALDLVSSRTATDPTAL